MGVTKRDRREYLREYYQRNRQRLITYAIAYGREYRPRAGASKRQLLADQGCITCGSRDGIILRNTKLGVLCVNCHRKAVWRPYKTNGIGESKSRAINKMMIFTLKVSVGCKNCGERDGRCLDFHHCDASQKSFDPTRKAKQSLTAAAPEIAKCTILCANCHWKTEVAIRGFCVSKS